MEGIETDRFKFFNDIEFLNVLFLICVEQRSIETSLRLEHIKKTYSPISLTDEGIETLLSKMHPLNA